MRVLVVTKIFPSSLEPLSAPFNLRQIAALANHAEVEVLEAVPWLPGARWLPRSLRAARLAALPAMERLHEIDVRYMRQLYVPKVGLPASVPLYLASMAPYRDRLRAADVVLATWAYPDGCAAVLAAQALGRPCVVKLHGSDVNVVLKTRAARAIASRVLPRAEAVVAVSRPLAEEMAALGVPRERVHLVTNGVDGALFRVRDRAASRRALGIPDDARVVLFVGRLEPQKGIRELLEAFEAVRARVPRALLALVGTGMAEREVRSRVGGSVRMIGPQPPDQVAEWMGACDALALPSWAEGTPNVVLESLASGRPVVATAVGGIPDLLQDARAGVLVPVRDAAALSSALIEVLGRAWDPQAVRACGPGSWQESAAGLRRVLEGAVGAGAHGQNALTSSATASNGGMRASVSSPQVPRSTQCSRSRR